MTTANETMAAAYLQLARVYRDDGREDLAAAYEVAADSLGATCPRCGGDLLSAEPAGPPIDGREVDRAPEREHDRLAAPHKPFSIVDCWCLGDDVETERYWARSPQTDGRSVAPPEADLPSPHATKEVG